MVSNMRCIILVLIICTLECLCWHNQHRRKWQNPYEPRIRAFSPQGIRVSLDSIRGLSAIKFVGTIFRDAMNVPIEGDFVRETYRHQSRGWVFEDKNIALKTGDVLNYEIFVARGENGFKLYDGNVDIFDLLDLNKCSVQYCKPINAPKPVTEEPPQKGAASAPPTEKSVTVPPASTNILEIKLKSCQQTVINTTNVLLELQSNIIRLETKNEVLLKILGKSPDARKLTLSGVIPQEDSAVETINFLIWEKLDIKPHVISAIRHNDTTIVFEVATIEEKLDILEEAEDRLASGRIAIF